MSKIKSAYLLSLCLAIVIVLAACSGGSKPAQPAETGGGTQQASPSAPPTETQTEPAKEGPKFDLGGETFKIVTWSETYPDDSTESGRKKLERVKAVEAKYNVKIEYQVVPWMELPQTFTVSGLAGEAIGDIVRLELPWVFPAAAEKGLLNSLEELVGDDLAQLDMYTKLKKEDADYFRQLGTYKGKTYGFNNNEAEGAGVYYNKTLFKQLGLTDLHELVEKDAWNWEAFRDTAKRATRDTNGDGKTDTWGLAAEYQQLATTLIASNEGQMVGDDGKVLLDSPNTMEALNFFARLFTEDKVVRTNEQAPGDWTAARNFFVEGNVAMVIGETWEAANRIKDMGEAEWGYVPIPKGPKGRDYVSGRAFLSMYFIPKGAKHAQAAPYIWNDLTSFENLEEERRQQYESSFLDEKDIATAELIHGKNKLVNYNAYPGFPYNATLVANIASGEETVVAAVEKVKAEAQSIVDDVLGKK